MKYCRLLQLLLLLVFMMMILPGCSSLPNKELNQLISSLGIEYDGNEPLKTMVLIPGNGCHSCIKNAIDDIHQSQDTIYVVACKSEKEFHLLTGIQAKNYSNVYLDKNSLSSALGFIETAPIIIVLNKGKIKEMKAFHKETEQESAKNGASLKVSQTHINFGTIKKEEVTEFNVIFENNGTDTLHITEIELSCECLSSSYSSLNLEIGEKKTVTFQLTPDNSGEIFRTITLYGNFQESPLEIEVNGLVKF